MHWGIWLFTLFLVDDIFLPFRLHSRSSPYITGIPPHLSCRPWVRFLVLPIESVYIICFTLLWSPQFNVFTPVVFMSPRMRQPNRLIGAVGTSTFRR